ncbi:MAG: hypothetical protein M3322_03750 [Actinomycetota bacterium]|nr:hypothetical protein [Actinomycetota bacterium]
MHTRGHPDRYAELVSRFQAGASYRNLKIMTEAWRYKGDVPSLSDLADARTWAHDLVIAVGEPWPF